MPFVNADYLVEALLTDEADPAFRVGIGIRSASGFRVKGVVVIMHKTNSWQAF